MFIIDEDMYISVTRGDIAFFTVTAEEDGVKYTFQPGDVVRFKVFEKKNCENVAFQKDFPITEATDSVEILLTEEETKIGDVISKPVDYWYEIELNPYTNPQTIVGYDDDGPKIFKLYPEGRDLGPAEIEEEDIPVVDEELDLTSTRPVQNQVVTKSLVELKEDVDTSVESSSQALSEVALERTRLNNLINSTTEDAELELIDIRVGQDGSTYATAGEAVRKQFEKVATDVDGLTDNVSKNKTDIESLEQSTSEQLATLNGTVTGHTEQMNTFNQKADDAKEIAEGAKAIAEQTATDTETQVKLILAMANEASGKATTATETAQATQKELEETQANMFSGDYNDLINKPLTMVNPQPLNINGKSYTGSSLVNVGTIGIPYGGTGATTVEGARENLGAASKNEVSEIKGITGAQSTQIEETARSIQTLSQDVNDMFGDLSDELKNVQSELEQTADIALSIQTGKLSSIETEGKYVVSKENNTITFADTEYNMSEDWNNCYVYFKDTNVNKVRVIGTLKFKIPADTPSDYMYHTFLIHSKDETKSYDIRAYYGTVTIDEVVSTENLYFSTETTVAGGVPLTSGTLQFFPYIPESNSSTYVQESAPSDPMKNDLWIWDGDIKRYDGSTWVDEIVKKTPLITNATATYDMNNYTESGTYSFELPSGDNQITLLNGPVTYCWGASLQVWSNRSLTHQMMLISASTPPNDISAYVRSYYGGNGSGWKQLNI